MFLIVFTENKAKEDIHCHDLLTIPYSIQESTTAPETLQQVEPPSASPDSSEVQEVFPTKDEISSNDDWAEVKVEDLKLDKEETQHKSLFRRLVFFFLYSFPCAIDSQGSNG